jgi:branched-chain amino acid transport system permease protein
MLKFFHGRKSFIIVLFLLLLVPLAAPGEYIMRVAISCCFYVILAVSLNLLAGIAGQISLGHIAFYGIGAYTSALLSLKLGLPFLACFLAAGLMASLIGFFISVPSLRLSGGYLAIITISFAEVIRLILLNWMSLTRGPMGLINIPPARILGFEFRSGRTFYYFVLFIAFITVKLILNIIDSNFGRKLKAIRDDEYAAEAMGINNYRCKIITFTIVAFFAGLGGSMYAHLMMYIDPSSFVSNESSIILSMVVLGSMGNIWGSIIAAVVLTALPELMRGFAAYRMLVYGLILVTVMLLKTVKQDRLKGRVSAVLTRVRELCHGAFADR